MNHSWGKTAAFLIFLVLFVALITEAGFRAAISISGKSPDDFRLFASNPGMRVEGRYVSAPFMPFALRPDSDFVIRWTPPPWPELQGDTETRVWRMHHNKWGFRGPEVTMEKPADTLRVVCLGGSTTYDTNTDGETWEDNLQLLLANAYPGQKIEVLNMGMNAASMPFHVSQFALFGVHFEPDLVILYAGHNDLWSGLGLEGFRPDYSHRLGHWDDTQRSIQHYIPDWAMQSAAVTGVAVIIDRWRDIEYDLVTQIWRDAPLAEDTLEGFWAFRNGMITIDGMANAHGAETLVVTPFWSFRGDEKTARLATMIREAATDAGIPVLDAANLMPTGDVSLVVDDVHFSPAGSALFADLLADFIVDQGLLTEQ